MSGCQVISFRDYKAGLTPLELREAEAMFAMTPAEREADAVKFRQGQKALFARERARDEEKWKTDCQAHYREHYEGELRRAIAAGVAKPEALDDWLDIPAAPASSPFRAIPASEFAGSEAGELSWLIEDHLPERGVGLAWGLSGSDKTGGVFDMLAHTHRGVTWRDKDVRRTVSAMIVAEGEDGFKNRMRAYAKDRGIDVSELPFVIPNPVDLRNGKQVAALAVELLAVGVRHAWFDTLQQNSPGADGNSDKDMGEVIANMKWLAKKLDGFCGVTHHEGKGGAARGARGSSVWRPAVDVELYFQCDGTHGTMRVEKLKEGAPNSVYPFERKIIALGTRANGKPISSVVVVQSDQAPIAKGAKLPTPQTDARKAYDIAVQTISKAGGTADEVGVIAAVADTKKEPDPGEKDRRKARATTEINRLVLQGHLIRAGRTLRTSNVVKGDSSENF